MPAGRLQGQFRRSGDPAIRPTAFGRRHMHDGRHAGRLRRRRPAGVSRRATVERERAGEFGHDVRRVRPETGGKCRPGGFRGSLAIRRSGDPAIRPTAFGIRHMHDGRHAGRLRRRRPAGVSRRATVERERAGGFGDARAPSETGDRREMPAGRLQGQSGDPAIRRSGLRHSADGILLDGRHAGVALRRRRPAGVSRRATVERDRAGGFGHDGRRVRPETGGKCRPGGFRGSLAVRRSGDPAYGIRHTAYARRTSRGSVATAPSGRRFPKGDCRTKKGGWVRDDVRRVRPETGGKCRPGGFRGGPAIRQSGDPAYGIRQTAYARRTSRGVGCDSAVRPAFPEGRLSNEIGRVGSGHDGRRVRPETGGKCRPGGFRGGPAIRRSGDPAIRPTALRHTAYARRTSRGSRCDGAVRSAFPEGRLSNEIGRVSSGTTGAE